MGKRGVNKIRCNTLSTKVRFSDLEKKINGKEIDNCKKRTLCLLIKLRNNYI